MDKMHENEMHEDEKAARPVGIQLKPTPVAATQNETLEQPP